MNIEKIKIDNDGKIYEHFGWKIDDDYHTNVIYGRGVHHEQQVHRYELSRDKDMPNYKILRAYQEKYFHMKRQRKYCPNVDVALCVCLFLILIIPGLIYLLIMKGYQKYINSYNANIERQMNEIIKAADALL